MKTRIIAIVLILVLITLLNACSARVELTIKEPSTVITTSEELAKPAQLAPGVQCPNFKLFDLGETPILPSIDIASTTPSLQSTQKLALMTYIDKLRDYTYSLKRKLRDTYTAYLQSCIE